MCFNPEFSRFQMQKHELPEVIFFHSMMCHLCDGTSFNYSVGACKQLLGDCVLSVQICSEPHLCAGSLAVLNQHDPAGLIGIHLENLVENTFLNLILIFYNIYRQDSADQ